MIEGLPRYPRRNAPHRSAYRTDHAQHRSQRILRATRAYSFPERIPTPARLASAPQHGAENKSAQVVRSDRLLVCATKNPTLRTAVNARFVVARAVCFSVGFVCRMASIEHKRLRCSTLFFTYFQATFDDFAQTIDSQHVARQDYRS